MSTGEITILVPTTLCTVSRTHEQITAVLQSGMAYDQISQSMTGYQGSGAYATAAHEPDQEMLDRFTAAKNGIPGTEWYHAHR